MKASHVKLFMVSAVANGPKTIALYSFEKTAEIKTLKIGPWIKYRILLVDLGFYKTQMFARIEENGGYLVSRIRKNMDHIVVSIGEGVPKTKCRYFIGKHVSEYIKQLSGKDIDAVVKIAFKRREYKGKQKQNEMLVRLVAVSNDEDEKHHIYHKHPARCFDCKRYCKIIWGKMGHRTAF